MPVVYSRCCMPVVYSRCYMPVVYRPWCYRTVPSVVLPYSTVRGVLPYTAVRGVLPYTAVQSVISGVYLGIWATPWGTPAVRVLYVHHAPYLHLADLLTDRVPPLDMPNMTVYGCVWTCRWSRRSAVALRTSDG